MYGLVIKKNACGKFFIKILDTCCRSSKKVQDYLSKRKIENVHIFFSQKLQKQRTILAALLTVLQSFTSLCLPEATGVASIIECLWWRWKCIFLVIGADYLAKEPKAINFCDLIKIRAFARWRARAHQRNAAWLESCLLNWKYIKISALGVICFSSTTLAGARN